MLELLVARELADQLRDQRYVSRFADPDLPDMVYLEQLTSGLWVDKRDEVDSYAQVMDRLVVQAEDPNDTEEIIGRILVEMERGA